ncbi:MAG TPA: hypothetical protein VL172_09240 [Kofleriaceae bacterium]|nr:hypothetical protein [Kofleriaceae bacterium]
MAWIAGVVALIASCAAPGTAAVKPLPLPGGEGGIGFDDLQYAPELHRLLVPAGRTGALDLVDPATGAVEQVTGFTADARYGGGHGEGTTSAVLGGGRIFAIDRSALQLDVVDPGKRAIVAHAKLAASPDYVRFVAQTGEVWVTEPDAEQIEVFTLGADDTPASAARIRVAGGPESLVISARRKTAYTHLWNGVTVAIDVAARKVGARWKNGCDGSRGIALDDERGWLFTGCAEGKVTAADVDHGGARLAEARTGAGVDIIAYAPGRARIYAPGGKAATLTVLAVGERAALRALASVPVTAGAHCAVTDDAGGVWVCDPKHGRLLAVTSAP